MKKKIEAELISIAHRVLKLKNRSETIVLHEEVKKLYEQLTILRFYEEHILIAEKEISRASLEEKLQQTETPVAKNADNIMPAMAISAEADTSEVETNVENEIEEVGFEEVNKQEEVKQEETEEEIANEEEILSSSTIEETVTSQPALFDEIDVANYALPQFVKVEDIPKELENIAAVKFEAPPTPIFEEKEPLAPVTLEVPKEEIAIEKTPEVVFEEPKTKSLNDRLNGTISFGLNDRIAFEKRLFGGNPDDFNRVVSQINTFDTFQEVQEFITDFVKPDYNNWDGKEEYETRFLEIIEKKFN